MEQDNAHHDPPDKQGRGGPAAMTAGCRSTRTSHAPAQRSSSVPGPAGTRRAPTDRRSPGRQSRPPTARCAGWSRPSGSPSCRCPGSPAAIRSPPPEDSSAKPSRPDTPNVIESPYAEACEAAPAGGADPGGHASPQEPRQNRPAAGSRPYSASQPAGMTGTAQNPTLCVRPAARKA